MSGCESDPGMPGCSRLPTAQPGFQRCSAGIRPKALFFQPELHVQDFTAKLRLKTVPEPGVCMVTTTSAGVGVDTQQMSPGVVGPGRSAGAA